MWSQHCRESEFCTSHVQVSTPFDVPVQNMKWEINVVTESEAMPRKSHTALGKDLGLTCERAEVQQLM